MTNQQEFILWLREVINPQADLNGNSVCVGDYSSDGTVEYYYPKRFVVNGDSYEWHMSSNHTKGRSMSTHYELWFSGPAFSGRAERIATGDLTMTKLRKGFRRIYNYYKERNG